jgi:protocatechuate 4,5-dioxygenase, beta chain
MAEIVGGFILPHDPLIFQAANAAPEAQRETVMQAYDEIAQRIGALQATTAIIIGSDHYMLFGPGCLPPMLIGVGDLDGPLERLPGIERGPIPSHPTLANWIFEHCSSAGFDLAVSKAMTVDHAIGIPYRLCIAPNEGVRTIPIYLASGVEPTIKLSRARQLGAAIRQAITAWPENERVVIIGSGGISHWVGMADMGKVNEDFDRAVLDCIVNADTDRLASYDDATLFAEGGNGALEIRNFVCAMACVAPKSGRVIAYEPVPEWITGLGFAEMQLSA